jgi:hypothetical protein
VRQFGDVALSVAHDWQARWELGRHIRQVDIGDLDVSLESSTPAVAFQYDRQPWSLSVRIAPRQMRVHVTPRYELQCSPEEARLAVHLNYQVAGSRAFEFRVRLNDWHLSGDPMESAGLVDSSNVIIEDGGTMILPLAQASPARAEITLYLRRPLQRDASRIEVPLPVPIADSIGTGELLVEGMANTELRVDMQKSRGLTAVPASQEDDEANVALRFRSLAPDAFFAAEKVAREQEVVAAAEAQIDISSTEANVDQRIDYEVKYKPVSELVLEGPVDMALNSDGFEIVMLSPKFGDTADDSLLETPLSLNEMPDEYDAEAPGKTKRFRVQLSQAQLGRFTVAVRYQVPRPASADGNTWRVPLIQPANGDSGSSALVNAARELNVALSSNTENSDWRTLEVPRETSGDGATYQFVSEGGATYLPLLVTGKTANGPSTAVVDRIWMQTWYSAGVRQDRAAIRFRSAGPEVTVELPLQSSARETEVLLDGELADVVSRAGGRIVVRMDHVALRRRGGNSTVAHTLELRSRVRLTGAVITRHQVSPPLLVGETTLSQAYWQIIVPGDEHVIRSPAQMSSATQWQWLGSFFGQRPIMSQADLEEWSGATAQQPPTQTENEYLYTGLSPVLSIELITAPRWLVVFIASSTVLGIAIALFYLPALRQGWVLIAFGCAIGGLAVVFPVPALLLAQAASLGVVVAVLGLVLRRIMAGPTHWPVIPSAGSSQRQPLPRSESILMPPVVAAASTAPTIPLRISDSER